MTISHDALDLTIQGPSVPGQPLTFLYNDMDMLVGKPAVGVLLECFLVSNVHRVGISNYFKQLIVMFNLCFIVPRG